MGTWTNQGFVAAPNADYYKDLIIPIFKEAFGDDFATDESLPQGVLITRLAELFYAMDMDGVEAFSRLNLNTMGGLFLDTIGNFRGIPRVLGAPQTGLVEITCNPNTFAPFTLPKGTVLTVVETGDTFVTVNEGGDTFTETTGTIRVQYTENGNSAALVNNTMTVVGFNQITNIKIVALFDGTDNESDISYRSRLIRDYPAANNTIEYILNKMREINTIRSVGVLYNDTASTDANGLPAYSTEFMYAARPNAETPEITAMTNNEVAKIIVDNKVPGSPTHGSTTVTVTDAFGQSKSIKLTKADPVRIHIYVQVSTPETTGMLDLVNRDAITDTIANYLNTLDIGKDISYSRCMAPLTADTGFDVADFAIKKDTWDPTYTGTVNFDAATLSGTVVACDGDAFATFAGGLTDLAANIVSGTITYDGDELEWVFEGKNSDDETVITWSGPQSDYETAGFTFTGTPQADDVVAFTCSITRTDWDIGTTWYDKENVTIGNREYAMFGDIIFSPDPKS